MRTGFVSATTLTHGITAEVKANVRDEREMLNMER
jgi:hypothetical protein